MRGIIEKVLEAKKWQREGERKMMKNEKLEIGYAKRNFGSIDFGNLREDSRDGIIKVEKEFWHKYVSIRAEFERMHIDLREKLPRKYLEKTNIL